MATTLPRSLDVQVNITRPQASSIVNNTNMLFIDSNVTNMGALLTNNENSCRVFGCSSTDQLLRFGIESTSEAYKAANTFFTTSGHPEMFYIGNIQTAGTYSRIESTKTLSSTALNVLSGIINGSFKITLNNTIDITLNNIEIDVFADSDTLLTKLEEIANAINFEFAQIAVVGLGGVVLDYIGCFVNTYGSKLTFVIAARDPGSGTTISPVSNAYPDEQFTYSSVTDVNEITLESLIEISSKNDAAFKLKLNDTIVPIAGVVIPEITEESVLNDVIDSIAVQVNNKFADTNCNLGGSYPNGVVLDYVEMTTVENQGKKYFKIVSRLPGSSLTLHPLETPDGEVTDLAAYMGMLVGDNPTVYQGVDVAHTYLGSLIGLDIVSDVATYQGVDQAETFEQGWIGIQDALSVNNVTIFGYAMSEAMFSLNTQYDPENQITTVSPDVLFLANKCEELQVMCTLKPNIDFECSGVGENRYAYTKALLGKRVAVIPHTYSEYPDVGILAKALGVNYNNALSSINLKFQSFGACRGVNISIADMDALLALRANLYTRTQGGREFLRNGTLSASEWFIDSYVNALNFASDAQAAVFDFISGASGVFSNQGLQKVLYTQDGLNSITQVIENVGQKYIANSSFVKEYADIYNRVLSGVTVITPLIQNADPQDVAKRKAPPFPVICKEAGAINSVVINISVLQ